MREWTATASGCAGMPITPERLALAREHASPHMWNVVPDNIVPLRMLIRDLVAEIDRLRAEAATSDLMQPREVLGTVPT